MTKRELVAELRKFSPDQAPAVCELGLTLQAGADVLPEQVTDAVFTLEQFAQNYPDYAPVYLDLIRGIEDCCVASLAAASNPGVVSMAAFRSGSGGDEGDDDKDAGFAASDKQVDVKKLLPTGDVRLAVFVKEGTEFNFDTCDHHELPDALRDKVLKADKALDTGHVSSRSQNPGSREAEDMIRQQLLLADGGAAPPPWAQYAETFNYEEVVPPWLQQERAEITSIAPETRFEKRALVANPLRKAAQRQIQALLPPDMQKLPGYLLGSNPKLAKGGDMCWLSAGLSMSPWTIAGVTNMCPFASKGCATGCLNISGQAEMQLKAKKQTIALSRIFKSKLCLQYPDAFAKYLEFEMERWLEYAKMASEEWPNSMKKTVGWHEGDPCSAKYGLSIRMNVLSDRPWEMRGLKFNWSDGAASTVMQRYLGVQFYDYTKWPSRMQAFLERTKSGSEFPKNYWLTFSWSEINAPVAFQVLDRGGNVAMAFDTKKGKALPEEFCGYPVIDADETDFRFLDDTLHADVKKKYGTGMICGLRLKGAKHKRNFKENLAKEGNSVKRRGEFTGGFTQYSEDCGMRAGKLVAENITKKDWYKVRLIEQAQALEAAQKSEGFKGTAGWHQSA